MCVNDNATIFYLQSAGDSISSGSGCATPSRPTSPTMSTVTGMTNRSNKKRRAPAPPGPSKVQTSKSITSLVDERYVKKSSHISTFTLNNTFYTFRRRNDVVDNHQLSISNSKSMSMSNLKNIDRNLNRSNASVISNTGSVTSINSVGKKRRAPVPPAVKKVPEPISEETPSMIHLENNNNTKPHRLEEIGRRVLPDLPVPKNKQNLVKPPARNIELDIVVPKPSPPAKDDPPPYTESAVEQPSDRPAPAPRSSLLEEAKIDVEMSSKKKSAKKSKNKVVPNNPVPLDPPVETQIEEVPILQETLKDRSKIERALSPDSALASSESSGSSLNRKNNNNQGKKQLVQILPYEQFRPVVRKSRQIQEKIAIFSGSMPLTPSDNISSTTGGIRVFPIPKKPSSNLLNYCQQKATSATLSNQNETLVETPKIQVKSPPKESKETPKIKLSSPEESSLKTVKIDDKQPFVKKSKIDLKTPPISPKKGIKETLAKMPKCEVEISSPVKNMSISADSIFSQAVESEENLARLSSVSAMSEKILSNGKNGHAIIHEKLEKLVKPSVRVSKQVEFFAKLLHSRNADFVDYFRQIKGTLKSQESFYFHDEDVEKAFQVSDVDLPVVEEDEPLPCDLPKKDLKKSENAKWNRFLKDISQMTIEIDDDSESFL